MRLHQHTSQDRLFVLAICLSKDVHGSTGCMNAFCAWNELRAQI